MKKESEIREYFSTKLKMDLKDIDSVFLDSSKPGSWYINLLIGFSAWLGSILIVGSLFTLMAFLVKGSFGMFVGLIAIGISVAVSRGDSLKNNSIFFEQVLVACSLIGLGIFFASAISTFKKSEAEILLVIAILQVIIVPLFRIKTAQFLGVLISVLSLSVFVFQRCHFTVFEIMASLICLLSFASFLKRPLFIKKLGSDSYQSICSALLFSSLALLICTSLINLESASKLTAIKKVRFPYPLLMLGLGINWLLIKENIKKININYHAALFFILTLGIVTYKHPEIIVTLGFVLITFSKGQILSFRLSIVSLATFIFYFYYSLQYTLLQKSISLMILGIVFLIGSVLYSKRSSLSVK